MRIIRRRIGRIAPTDIDSTQVNESGKIGIQSNLITYPKFPPANLVVTSTVQATPEWFESWRQTVEFFIDQRMQQNLLPLQQMINSMIEEKIQDYQLSGVQ